MASRAISCAGEAYELVEKPILFVIPRSEGHEESAFWLIPDRLQIPRFARDDNSWSFTNALASLRTGN
jgi:hypothetical protein